MNQNFYSWLQYIVWSIVDNVHFCTHVKELIVNYPSQRNFNESTNTTKPSRVRRRVAVVCMTSHCSIKCVKCVNYQSSNAVRKHGLRLKAYGTKVY